MLSAGMDQAGATLDAPPDPKVFEDYFDLVDLDVARPVDFGPFSIECRPTIHSIPTTAFRVTTAGRTIGFSADTAYDPSLIDWLAPCDLIVHEATLQTSSPLHTPYHLLAALPEPLRRKIRLIHYPDDLDAATSLIEPLAQGRCYRV
jgi:ribonuclease BN (tRNA processing enzyme)